MTDLSSRLRALLASQHIRTLASLAPLGVVASGAGLVIGAAVASPALAAAGLGGILTSFATNVMSSVVYDIVKPDLDEGERERKIAQGLKDHDAGVIRLVAEALTAAGPDLAQALPDATRAELIAALEQGMREAGGPLDAIAAPYTAALGQPQTDWAVLQGELRRTIADTRMLMKVGHEGEIREAEMRAEQERGTLDMTMEGGDRSKIINAKMISSRAAPSPAKETLTCPDCNAPLREGQQVCARCGLSLPGEGM